MKIGIEFIAANALVEVCENLNTRCISFDDLKKYGITIQEVLRDDNIEAVLLFSDYYLIQFSHNYSDMFEVKDKKIYIKENVSCDEIREKIISYMVMDLLKAMLDKRALEVLGIKR